MDRGLFCWLHGSPAETRTPVPALKGRCPRPLDDGAALHTRIAWQYRLFLALNTSIPQSRQKRRFVQPANLGLVVKVFGGSDGWRGNYVSGQGWCWLIRGLGPFCTLIAMSCLLAMTRERAVSIQLAILPCWRGSLVRGGSGRTVGFALCRFADRG